MPVFLEACCCNGDIPYSAARPPPPNEVYAFLPLFPFASSSSSYTLRPLLETRARAREKNVVSRENFFLFYNEFSRGFF